MHKSEAARLVRILSTAAVVTVLAVGCGPQSIEPLPTARPQAPSPISPSVPTAAPTAATPATLIFHGGTLLTMDESQPTAEAIALADDRILAVGSNADILALQLADTQVIDLQGRTLMPGFVDSHSHFFNQAAGDPATGTLDKAQSLALQNGITTTASMYTDGNFVKQMQVMAYGRRLFVRTSLYLLGSNNCGDPLGDWYKQYAPTHEPGEMLRIAGVKLFLDGGSCGYPALSFDRAVGGKGDLFFTEDALNSLVASIDQAGYQVAMHAVGDRAVDQALNAIEFALDGEPNTLRHRIEHNYTVSPDDYPRYQELGAVASYVGHIWSCKGVFHVPSIIPDPEEFRAWNFPYRLMLDASPEGHFAWQTDYPWASANPFQHLYSLVTANEIGGDMSECADPSWAGNKTLMLDEALRIMTMGSAYALFREEEVGSLEVGKYADLIIISGDPSTDLEAIRDIEVWVTMVGGQVRWCAAGHEALCPGDPG